MSNSIFRAKAISRIEGALAEYQLTRELSHPGVKGLLREIVVRDLLQPILPPFAQIGTGIIVDSKGKQSNQTDIVLYCRDLIPPLLYSPDTGLFPIEACLCSIEVKSVLDLEGVQSAVDSGKILAGFDYRIGEVNLKTGLFDEVGTLPIYRILFAFESTISASPDNEIERLRKLQPTRKDAGVDLLCVVSQGLWAYSWTKKGPEYRHAPASKQHDEVITLMWSLHNQIPIVRLARQIPLYGEYLQ